MAIYNLIEHGDSYSKIFGKAMTVLHRWSSFKWWWQCCCFSGNAVSFKFKQKITVRTTDNGNKKIYWNNSIKYFSNFWGTLEVALTNCAINIILTWAESCVVSILTDPGTLAITNTKLMFRL